MIRNALVCGYLLKLKYTDISFKIYIPYYSDIPVPIYDWCTSLYSKMKEELLYYVPKVLGKCTTLTQYLD